MKYSAILLFLALLLLGCNNYSQVKTANIASAKRPKNVILMIGDGMGITQITAGLYSNQNSLHLERFPIVGLHKSYAADDLITDSAAGATAFACGVKTYNGAIGVDNDTIPVRTLLEDAEEQGFATGLVATSTITHATPASFIAHAKSRKMYETIAADFLKTDIDFFVGGGKKHFDRRETDDRNLAQELEAKGYYVSDYSKVAFTEIEADFTRPFAYFTADNSPLPVSQGRDYLLPTSIMAPHFLEKRSKKGFFLMIEGAQIDWGGHANSSDYIITEMLDFDEAVGAILDYAQEDGETLVVVTADHETGGYAINPGSKMDSVVAGFTTDYHTAALIPVFAYGPGAGLFAGMYENTAIYYKLQAAMGMKKNNENKTLVERK